MKYSIALICEVGRTDESASEEVVTLWLRVTVEIVES
jgi:hypothetical protein